MSGSERSPVRRWGKRNEPDKVDRVQSLVSDAGPHIWDCLPAGDNGDTPPALDIVFVHGLRGHYLNTWSTTDKHTGRVFWPGDFLRDDVKDARVISWGYDAMAASAQPGSVVSQNSIFGHAGSLLNDLANARKDDPQRPILFVGHSLGGLVIKEAVIRAASSARHARDPRLGEIYASTIGVIFLGTPHRGSPQATLGQAAARFTARLFAAGSNMQVLEFLSPNSHALDKQMYDFVTVSSHLPVVCFHEELNTGRLGLIVPKTSAVYDGKMVSFDSIPADHREMVRFSSRSDIGYIRVLGHIRSIWDSRREMDRCAEEERRREERKKEDEALQERRKYHENLRQDILGALRFGNMNTREDNIDEAHSSTLDWVFEEKPPLAEPEDKQTRLTLAEWLKQDRDAAFWVSGKAGSGKSTLMKWVCRHKCTQELLQDWAGHRPLVVGHFFLSDLGNERLGKCREGMLRSILHQILASDHGLELAIETYPEIFGTPIGALQKAGAGGDWGSLKRAFNRALDAISARDWRICLFVDGLDEYRNEEKWKLEQYTDEDLAMVYEGEDGDAVWGSNASILDDQREVAGFFKDLWTRPNLKLCVSSRELMVFEDTFAALPRMRMQECTRGDIERFATDRLSHLDVDQRDKDGFVKQITVKSCGVFLWVRLVVNGIVNGYSSGDSVSQLHTIIDSAPSRLCGKNGLFAKMLEPAIGAPESRLESSRIFRIMEKLTGGGDRFAEDISRALEIYKGEIPNFNLALGMPVHFGDPRDISSLQREGRRKIIGRSGGLLECEAPHYNVRFMHYAVRQFVYQKDIWDHLFLPDATFDATIAVFLAILMHIKTDGPAAVRRMPRYDGPWMDQDRPFSACVIQASGLAHAAWKLEDSPICIAAMDELSRTVNAIYDQETISQSNHCYYPHGSFAPHDNPLLNAALWGISGYIRSKLQAPGDEASTRQAAQKLLEDLIWARSHTLRCWRHPDTKTAQQFDSVLSYTFSWWQDDQETVRRLVELGACLRPVWSQVVSLGYVAAFTSPPIDPFPTKYSASDRRGQIISGWIWTLNTMLDLGADPFQQTEIKYDDWIHAKAPPDSPMTLLQVLEDISHVKTTSVYAGRRIQVLLKRIGQLVPGEPISQDHFCGGFEGEVQAKAWN